MLPEALGIRPGHRIVEALQPAIVMGEALPDQLEHVPGTGIGRTAEGLGNRMVFRQRLAIVLVQVPDATARLVWPLHQPAVSPAHAAVEGLHAQLGARPGPAGKGGATAEESVIAMPAYRYRQVQRPQRLLQSPLAGLGQPNLTRARRLCPERDLGRQRALVVGVVQGAIENPEAARAHLAGEVAHGAEDQGDLARMMRDIAGFAHHFGEQQHVLRGIGVAQGGQARRKLIAEDRQQAPNGALAQEAFR